VFMAAAGSEGAPPIPCWALWPTTVGRPRRGRSRTEARPSARPPSPGQRARRAWRWRLKCFAGTKVLPPFFGLAISSRSRFGSRC